MSKTRKALAGFALVMAFGPGLSLIGLAGLLALAGVSGTMSLYTALVGVGLLVIGWVRLNW